MPTSDELSQRAYQEARENIVTTVADKLRERRTLLIAGRFITTPPEPDWNALANEAINNRTIGGNPLSELGLNSDGRTVESMIPDANRVHLIATDVAEGVRDNTGSIGMLQGATIGQALSGFWETIKEHGFGTAISGVFNLIFGDGNSESAQLLTRNIAQITAGDVSNGVTQRLWGHKNENGLTDDQINQIGAQVQNSVRRQAGLPPIDLPGPALTIPAAPVALTSNPLPSTDSQTIRTAIRTQVMQTMGLRQEGTNVVVDTDNASGVQKLSQMAQAVGIPGGQFNDSQRAAIADTMTDALHQVATANPPMRDPNQIRSSIRTQLAARANDMGFDRMSDENKNVMLDLMANEMTLSYLQPNGQLRAMDRRPEVTQFIEHANTENIRLKATLMQGQIRPAVLSALGMQENPPGTFVNAPASSSGPPPKIVLLERVAGHALDNTQRGEIVSTMSSTLQSIAMRNPPLTDPTAIRNEFKSQLQARAGQMGFGNMSPENQERLFTLMANESTVSYLQQMSPGTQQARDTFIRAVQGDPRTNTQGENQRLMGELVSGSIRPLVINGLNMREDPPGTFVDDNTVADANSTIKKLGQVAGRPLTNDERTVLVNTMTQSFQTLAQRNPPLNITQTRDFIQGQLAAQMDNMGFSALSPEDKNRLSLLMANQATTQYIGAMNVGTADQQREFNNAALEQNADLQRQLTPGAARRTLEAMLNPATENGRNSLNMLTLATGSGSLNRDAFINALAPVMAEIENTQPRPEEAVIRLRIEGALRNANPPTGIINGQVPGVARAITTQYLNPNAPSQSPGAAATGSWTDMINGLKRENEGLYNQLNRALPLESDNGIKRDISRAIDNVMRDHPDFHSASIDQRREWLRSAVNNSLREGSIPDGRNVRLDFVPGSGGIVAGMSVAPNVARDSLTNLIVDRITGSSSSNLMDYMPRPGTPGVRLTGAVGDRVEAAATLVGREHLQNLDLQQAQNVAEDVLSGNLTSPRVGAAVISVINYWSK